MMHSCGKYLLLPLVLLLFAAAPLRAQFRAEAFSQSYNDDKASPKDTSDRLFSFKEYFGALGHKNTTRVGTLFAGSLVFVGSYQI